MLTNTERLELRRRRMVESPPILRGGFRPFFLGAAVWAIIALAAWLTVLFGYVSFESLENPLAWHRHEMLFGFVGAAIAGFVLTAVPNWTGRLPAQPSTLDKLIIALTAAALLAWLSAPFSLVSAVLLSSASVAHFLRLSKWQGWRCGSNALVWILHLAYLWLPVGLLLLAGAQVEIVTETAGIHALSTGAMATMILAVMSRASLGHTGRALITCRKIVVSYALITIAAALRVQAALPIGDGQVALAVAGAAWFGAFGLFLIRYGPILWAPRSHENTKKAQA